MHSRLRPSPAMVIALIALFVSLGGTAAALSGSNTVFTDDIANDTQPASGGNPAGGLVAPDLRAGSVGTSEAANNSLTGTDIDESSLGQVPMAKLGGVGGQNEFFHTDCNPESTSFTLCGSVQTPNLSPTRYLVIGQLRAEPDVGNGNGAGRCRIASASGSEAPVFANGGQTDVMAIAGVTGVVGGLNQLEIYCNETADGIRFFDGHVTFVALSPG